MGRPLAHSKFIGNGLFTAILILILIFPFSGQAQDTLVRDTLYEWVKTGKATPEMIEALFQNVDLQKRTASFEAAIAFVKKEFPGKGENFIKNVVIKTLDKERFKRVDALLAQVAERHELDAIVRTGSSGMGYLNRPGDYRLFFSDDDISFVGKDASAAAANFNQLLEGAGLKKLKVEGFTIFELKARYPGYDTIGLEMLDRGKYVGQAALKQIKTDMYNKGAVVYQKPGNQLIKMPQPLSSFVATNQKKILQEYIGEAFGGPIQKYGALTAVASSERQIGNKGWDKLDDAEKIKYVKREFKALRESRGLADIGNLDDVAITQREEFLDFLLFKVSRGDKLTFEEGVRLISLRSQHINIALNEIPQKMESLIQAARASNRSLSGNPEIRAAVQELATGFALLKQSGISVSLNPDQVIAEMLQKFPKGSEIYKILYTAHQQGKDLVEFLAAWEKGVPWNREAQEEFLKMLERLSTREEKVAATRAMEEKVAKTATKEELSVLRGLGEMYENALGGTFLDKMIKHPTGHRLMIGVLAAAGGKYVLTSMYDSWSKGTVKEDLTDAGLVLIDFVPPVMSMKKMVNNGLKPETIFSFVKDVVYFTPYWPLALAGDIIETSINIGEAVQLQNYTDGLIDILVYSGKFDEDHKFLRLELPNEKVVERADLQKFLFETEKTSAYNSNIKNLPYRIPNLSAVTNEVYFKHYYPNDQVLNKLTKAYQDQLRFINTRESIGSLKDFEWKKSAESHFNWLMGYESVCAKSPETWCKMLAILKKNMEDRKARMIPDYMIPHLIMLAEEMHKTINADDELSGKLLELQKKMQDLKGGSLGINLKQVVDEKAEIEAKKGDTPQNKDIKRGEYWRAAFEAYQKIYNNTVSMKSKVQAETGYERLQVLQFPFSGDYKQDQVRSAQSIDGFFSDSKTIRDDIQGIKGAAISPQDSVDKQALDILGDVVFRWRPILDGENKAEAVDPQTAVFGAKRFPQPGKDSPFFKEYQEALNKVRELYGKKDDFQALLKNGAQIIKEQEFLLLGKGSGFEIKFTDEGLKKESEKGVFSFKWTATPKDSFRPDEKSQKVSFA
ncbi:MAG: hypothetical protein C0407_07230, partial [Desulfobacca sp.]|nr:hypothetical protein [Desulfobacca sp.]